ncbi:MAG: hypothetical protein P8I94_09660 [Emcibacteraceae bacterium]|nr:hypothetical protein [Emcibacteraceae bacterium]
MTTLNLSPQINSIGVKAVIAIVITAIISMFLPLAAPEPNQNDAALWLMNDMSGYVFGWLNQIAAMWALSVVLAVAAWQVFETHPLRAITSWMFTLMATMAFFIVKFIDVWSVPLMAKAIASESAQSANAEIALTALGPSVAFGFGPSLDYLGFALYAVACLVIFRSLYKLSLSTKIAAIGFLAFAVLYLLIIALPYISILGQADIEGAITISVIPLLIAIVALFFRFKSQCN